jgi:hypothetical protein
MAEEGDQDFHFDFLSGLWLAFFFVPSFHALQTCPKEDRDV